MIKKPFKLALAAALLGGFVLTGCQKEVGNDAQTDTVAVETTAAITEDDAEADAIFADVYDQAAGIDGDIGTGQIDLFNGPVTDGGNTSGDVVANDPTTDKCFTVTVTPLDPGKFPKTVVINYGAGCKGRDGRTRSGKVITVYSNRLVVPGAQAVTEFDNYYVDGTKVEGRHVTRNNSTSAVLVITRIVQNGKLTKPNGNYIKWNAEHTNTQVAGLGTPGYPRDDEFNITGGARGETFRAPNTNTWSRQILEPLHKRFTCRWFDKGIVKITRDDKTSRLNYGDGTCDNKATITIEGVTKEITLK